MLNIRVFHLLMIGVLALFSCQSKNNGTDQITNDYGSMVNPFIGTGGHGHTYPGAVTPFGMVQLSPDNGTEGWDWCSGYHYSDSVIAGFSHLHLSGTGIGDYADISVMPYYLSQLNNPVPQAFRHKNESAQPGAYMVQLDNGITAHLTTTRRTGFHRYSFPKDSIKAIQLNLGFAINWDEPVETKINVVNDTLITGFRKSTGWAKDQHVFFAMVFSEPLNDYILINGGDTLASKEMTGKEVRGIFKFPPNIRPLLLKVGISSANTDGAIENIKHDLPDWNFNAVKSKAGELWNTEMSKIRAKLIQPELDTVFYSALYHASLAPALFSDINGNFKAVDSTVWNTSSFDRYTVFSLWDTFRAAHPLFTITQPDRTEEFLLSIISFYEECGLLPVWALAGNETNTMTGYHAVPVLADAIFKGYLKGDEERAYQAMVASAQQNIRGTNYYREYGYIPADLDGWSVTKTLEYSFDDWCIAKVAKKLNKPEDYQYYSERARNYKNLFNPVSGFMRARLSDGSWLEPFDPFHSEHGFDGMYIEGTAWQHTWFVPHDIKGLIDLYGSEERFLNFLDSTFQVSSKIKGENASIDITGLIGQYAHGNEPSHHISYLYNYAGKPWKTQKIVRQIMMDMYTNDVNGLPGNEDCGQMSAWYIFSSLGFYPVNPAEGIYVIGSPLIKKAVLHTKGGPFTVIAENNSRDNVFIQEVFLNGQPLEKSFITHHDIVNGGQLRFVMGDQPNKTWATDIDSRPPSMTKY